MLFSSHVLKFHVTSSEKVMGFSQILKKTARRVYVVCVKRRKDAGSRWSTRGDAQAEACVCGRAAALRVRRSAKAERGS